VHFFLEVLLFTVGFFLAYRSGWKAGFTRGITTQVRVFLADTKEKEKEKEKGGQK
jgi:hypothetical protein